MSIDLGATVRTTDGHDAGQLKHAIWDPRGGEITQYVISTGGLLGHDVIVSKEVLETARREDDAWVLDMTKRELDQLAHYESTSYTAPPADWTAPEVHGFPGGGYLWPVAEDEFAPVEETAPSEGIGRGPMINKGL
jgi:hypothetical protein